MPTGSGLDSQFAIGDETTPGTQVTPNRLYAHEEASLTLTPTYIESDAIQAGSTFRSIDNVGITRKTAGGKFVIPVTYKNFGLWWKYLIGSTATPASDGTTAKKQVHTPGGMRGVSFTAQVGKPDPATGTVNPRTYKGCKVADWELAIADGEQVKLSGTIDAWDEDTAAALVAATYVSANPVWTFAEATSFKIGGTPTTASGECTVAGGTAVSSVITSLTLKGTNPMAAERFGVGNAGIKKEQLPNGFVEIEGSFEGEYNPTQFETPFRAGTTTTLEINLQSVTEVESGKPYLLSFILPAVKITECPVEVSGPDLVKMSGAFKVYKDATNAAIQVKIRNADTAV